MASVNASGAFPPPPLPDLKVASAIVSFLHSFPRFNNAPATFSPYSEAYGNYLQTLIFVCMFIGLMFASLLSLLLLRRDFFTRQKTTRFQYRRVWSTELPTLVLLAFTAFSSFAGIYGGMQMDYSIRTVQMGVENTSHVFQSFNQLTGNLSLYSALMRANADDLLVSYANLPKEASILAQESTRMQHAVANMSHLMHALPLEKMHNLTATWENQYFWLRASTNSMISLISITTLVCISSISWTFPPSMRFSMILMIILVPLSMNLMGIYMAGSVAGGDYCVTPKENTLKLFAPILSNDSAREQQRLLSYFIDCDATNGTPFSPFVSDIMDQSTYMKGNITAMRQAMHNSTFLPEMEKKYLIPIESEYQKFVAAFEEFQRQQSNCQRTTQQYHQQSVDAFCAFGVLGTFSLWLHQISLTSLLLLSVLALASVWDRLHEQNQDWAESQYSLLAHYEEENTKEVYRHVPPNAPVYLVPSEEP